MPVLRTNLIATYVLPQLTVYILHRDWEFKKTYPEKYSNNGHIKETTTVSMLFSRITYPETIAH